MNGSDEDAWNISKVNTVEPRYNEVLGTMKLTLLYQVSHDIRVKNPKKYKELGPAKLPCYKRVLLYTCISDLFITRFHCTRSMAHKNILQFHILVKKKKKSVITVLNCQSIWLFSLFWLKIILINKSTFSFGTKL